MSNGSSSVGNCSGPGRYAANPFTYERDGDRFLFMPDRVSELLEQRIRDRGITPVSIHTAKRRGFRNSG